MIRTIERHPLAAVVIGALLMFAAVGLFALCPNMWMAVPVSIMGALGISCMGFGIGAAAVQDMERRERRRRGRG